MHRRILRAKEHAARKRDRLPGSAFILNIQQHGAMKMFAHSPLLFIHARERPSQILREAEKQHDKKKKKRKRNFVQCA